MNIFTSGFISRWGQMIAGLFLVFAVAAAPVPAHAGWFSDLVDFITEPFVAVYEFVVESVVEVVDFFADAVIEISDTALTFARGDFSEGIHKVGCLVGAGIEVFGFEDFRCKKPQAGTDYGSFYGGSSGSGGGAFSNIIEEEVTIVSPQDPGRGATLGVNTGTAGSGGDTIVVRTLSAVNLGLDHDGILRYRLSGTALLTPAGVGHSSWACFQVRLAYRPFGDGCHDRVIDPVPSSGTGEYSVGTNPLVPGQPYVFRAIAKDRETDTYYWGEEIAFGSSDPTGVLPDFGAEITSLQKRLEITFLTNRPEETDTVSITSTAGTLTGGMSLSVGQLTDAGGVAVPGDRIPQVFLDNSLTPSTSKTISSVPAITNLRLRFPGSLPSGTYKLPISTFLGELSKVFVLDVIVTNLDNTLREE